LCCGPQVSLRFQSIAAASDVQRFIYYVCLREIVSFFFFSFHPMAACLAIYAIIITTILTVGRHHPAVTDDTRLVDDKPFSVLPSAEVSRYRPFTRYAGAAYCRPEEVLAWSCGGRVFFFALLLRSENIDCLVPKQQLVMPSHHLNR